jgi:hypothetical protein
MKEEMMARPTQTQVVAKAREEERLRAIEIVHAVYGGHPRDTIAYYQYAKAINLIKGEDNE